MAERKPQLPEPLSAIQRYGLAVLSVSVALGGALFMWHHSYRDVEASFFLFAICVTAWYGGIGPSVLAIVLALFSFDYYFVEPRYSFFFTLSDLPYFIAITLFASLITWFSATRRRVEEQLRQKANLLNLTHDTIFVRDMNDVITYWNRGAQELYGWTAEQAIGKRAHELLQTVFPAPSEEIHAELLRSGRWDGELQSPGPTERR